MTLTSKKSRNNKVARARKQLRSTKGAAPAHRPARAKKWSKHVNETSNALDLEPSLFNRSAGAIAASLKRAAEQSHRRKASPYQSAMSMLNFYINRGGRKLSGRDKLRLEQAKPKLRQLFHRESK